MSLVKDDGAEIFIYDNFDFPVFCRHNWIPAGYPLAKYTPMHWHDEIELIYIEKGKIHHKINGDFITLNKGDGLFINSRQLHELVTDKDSDCTLYCLIFNPTLLANCISMEEKVSNIAENELLEYVILNDKDKWKKDILKLVEKIVLLNEKENMEIEIIQELYKLWGIIFDNNKIEKSNQKRINVNQRIIKEMIRFIQKEYMNEITLEDICKAGGVGKTKCTELFKQYFHMTPANYIKCYRIEKSFELLANTDMPVSEIAYEVGFTGASYYTESFKQIAGITPLAYRKEIKKNE